MLLFTTIYHVGHHEVTCSDEPNRELANIVEHLAAKETIVPSRVGGDQNRANSRVNINFT